MGVRFWKRAVAENVPKTLNLESLEQYYLAGCPYLREMHILGEASGGDGHNPGRGLWAVVVPDLDRLRGEGVTAIRELLRYHLETLGKPLDAGLRVEQITVRAEAVACSDGGRTRLPQIPGGAVDVPPARRFPEVVPRDPVEDGVFGLIREIGAVDALHPEMHLELDLGLDSLHRIRLFSSLERAFAIQIGDEEGAVLYTVRELVEGVERRLAGRGLSADTRALPWCEILRSPLRERDRKRFDENLRHKFHRVVAMYLAARFVYWVGRLFLRLRFEGLENLPAERPYVICANHLSYLDTFLVASILPARLIHRLFFLGHTRYFSRPLTVFAGRLLKVIPVDPGANARHALRLAAEALRQGHVLCVFPEGGRSIDGRLKPFRKGPAILACELRIPVVPVRITGTYEVWPRASDGVGLHPVRLHIGRPLFPEAEETPDDFNERLQQVLGEPPAGSERASYRREIL